MKFKTHKCIKSYKMIHYMHINFKLFNKYLYLLKFVKEIIHHNKNYNC